MKGPSTGRGGADRPDRASCAGAVRRHLVADQNVKWQRAVPGGGNSSPIVWGDRDFLTTAHGTAAACRCSRSSAPTASSFGRPPSRRAVPSACTRRTATPRRRRRPMVSWFTPRSGATACSRSTSTARSPGITSSARRQLSRPRGFAGPLQGSDVLYPGSERLAGQTRVRRRVRHDDRQADLEDAARETVGWGRRW